MTYVGSADGKLNFVNSVSRLGVYWKGTILMRAFIQRHLDPSTRLGEAMFGLIMALGITGAVRISSAESTNRELFVAILGCNLAWGVVDGVMFALLALFERARKYRIVKEALNSPS